MIFTLIAAAITLAATISSGAIKLSGANKAEVSQTMQEMVQMYGYSLPEMKRLFPKLYNRNPTHFNQEYAKAYARYKEMEKNDPLNVVSRNKNTFLIIIIIALAVYYMLKK